MSDSHQKEPGRFGEDGAAVIQVTPGQIVGAALFLLVAAAIIFFAGMFARGLTMTASNEDVIPTPQPSSDVIEGTSIPAPDPKIPEVDPAPQPQEPAEEPPLDEPDPEPVVVVEVPSVVEPESAPAEVEAPKEVMELAVSEPEPAPEPEPATPEETTPLPPEPEPEPLPEIPPSTDGPYTVQVMSIGIAKRAQAEAFQRDAHENKDVQLELVETADGKSIRAFAGSYADKATAGKARDALLHAGFDGCFVKKRD